MNLIEKNLETYHWMHPQSVRDGVGGSRITWTAGAAVKAALAPKLPAGEPAEYTLYASRNTYLPPHAVLRRDGDGMTLQVTPAERCETPVGAGLGFAVYTVREWRAADDES
ncbi:MAG: hypothetical protein IJJ85_05880 [Clostridia bacterium]|nr:hypothetical protein [Clostridia bacterium]